MQYLNKKFSLIYGSNKYIKNWERIFEFNPIKDCSHFKKCNHIGGIFCDKACDFLIMSDKEFLIKMGKR